jgi:hypothetical protein
MRLTVTAYAAFGREANERFRVCDSNDILADEETKMWPEVADSWDFI